MAGQTFIQKIKILLEGAGKATKDSKKLAGGMNKLATSALAAGAAYFSARGIIAGLSKSIDLARKQVALETAFVNLGKKINLTEASVSKFSKAVDGTVNSVELMRVANQAMTLGVVSSEEEMSELFDTAQRLGKSLGVDTVSAIDSLVTGMGRQSIMMLDNLGIIVSTADANKTYADSIGKTVNQLTDQETKLAFNAAALDSAKSKVKDLGAETLDSGDKISQMTVSIEEATTRIGESLLPIIADAADFFADVAEGVGDFFTALNETPMEATIRQMKEMGLVTKDQEKTLLARNLILAEHTMLMGNHLKTVEEVNAAEIRANKEKASILPKILELQMKGVEGYEDMLFEATEAGRAEAEAHRKELDRFKVLKDRLEVIEEQSAILEENKEILAEIELIKANLDALDVKEIETTLPAKIKKTKEYTSALKEGWKVLTQTEEITKKNVIGAAAIGASTTSAADAASGAATVFITAKLQEAIATMIAKAFGELGFFGGLGVAMGASVLGKNLATTIKSIQAAEGFDGIVTEPTLILAGEEGAEYVDIEPTMNEGQGMGGASIVFTGNVLSRDFIEDEAVPMIRAALRKGGDIGIS